MSIELKLAKEKHANKWNKLLEQDPLSNFYDRFEWCSKLYIISQNIKVLPYIIEKNAYPIGVLPLCLRKVYHSGYLESLPFSEYGGGSFFRKKPDKYLKEIVYKLIKIGIQNNCFRVTIRRAFFSDLIEANLINKFVIVEDKDCTFTLSLQDKTDNIFRRFKKSRRNSVRQALKRGAVIREAENFYDLKQYYRIYLCNIHRLKSSPLPFQFFKYLWNVFKPKGEMKIFLTEYDNKIIAGALRFFYKKVIYEWGRVSLKEYYNLRPSDLLIWHIIKWGIENDMKLLDFGSTQNDPSSGHYLYKKAWGGEKKTLFNYHIILQPKRMKFYKFIYKSMERIKKSFQ